MADILQNIARGIVQNELFYVAGAYLIANTPPFAPYWQAIIRPTSPLEHYQFLSDSTASTVTQTAPIFPKPTTLTETFKSTIFKPVTLTDKVYETIVATGTARHTATITSTVPCTTTDTVTESITSCVSTFHHNHYKTVWTSYGDPKKCMETMTLFRWEDYTVRTVYETARQIGGHWFVESDEVDRHDVDGPPAPVLRFRGTWDRTNWYTLVLCVIALLFQYLRYIYGSDAVALMRELREADATLQEDRDRAVQVTNRTKVTLMRKRQDMEDKYIKERDERAECDGALIELGVNKNQGDSVGDETVAKDEIAEPQSALLRGQSQSGYDNPLMRSL